MPHLIKNLFQSALILFCMLALSACEAEKRIFQSLNNPYGGAFAVRIPDQLKVNDRSFTYQISIKSKDGSYHEEKTYQFERMNFHPFNKEVAPFFLQYIHFEFFTLPQKQREEAYTFLSAWDKRISVNKDLFELKSKVVMNLCYNQKIPKDKVILSMWHKKNKGDDFEMVFDDLGKNPARFEVQYGADIPC